MSLHLRKTSGIWISGDVLSAGYNCPKCGSSYTRSYEVIYEGGTSHGASSGTGSGFSIGRSGLRLFFGCFSSRSKRQSKLAESASPPLAITVYVFIVWVLLWLFTSLSGSTFWPVILCSILVDVMTYYSRFEKWLMHWRCLRCGNVFSVGEERSERKSGVIIGGPHTKPVPFSGEFSRKNKLAKQSLASKDRGDGINSKSEPPISKPEDMNTTKAPSKNTAASTGGRDYTKYVLQGNCYGKGRLVLAVVKQYVDSHPDTTLSNLKAAFPDSLQSSSGIQFSTTQTVVERFDDIQEKDYRRFFMKDNELISTADSMVAVSREWNRENIIHFMERAAELGFCIQKAE